MPDNGAIDLTNIRAVVFGRGLVEEDVLVIINHLLDIVPPGKLSKTRQKNFVRAMTCLIVYVHYVNTYQSTQFESMMGKGSGFADSFEYVKPFNTDKKYCDLVKKLFMKSCKGKVRQPYHPLPDELTTWSGNLHKYVSVSLKSLFLGGLYSTNDDVNPKGLYSVWNDFLLSIGIDFSDWTANNK